MTRYLTDATESAAVILESFLPAKQNDPEIPSKKPGRPKYSHLATYINSILYIAQGRAVGHEAKKRFRAALKRQATASSALVSAPKSVLKNGVLDVTRAFLGPLWDKEGFGDFLTAYAHNVPFEGRLDETLLAIVRRVYTGPDGTAYCEGHSTVLRQREIDALYPPKKPRTPAAKKVAEPSLQQDVEPDYPLPVPVDKLWQALGQELALRHKKIRTKWNDQTLEAREGIIGKIANDLKSRAHGEIRVKRRIWTHYAKLLVRDLSPEAYKAILAKSKSQACNNTFKALKSQCAANDPQGPHARLIRRCQRMIALKPNR